MRSPASHADGAGVFVVKLTGKLVGRFAWALNNICGRRRANAEEIGIKGGVCNFSVDTSADGW